MLNILKWLFSTTNNKSSQEDPLVTLKPEVSDKGVVSFQLHMQDHKQLDEFVTCMVAVQHKHSICIDTVITGLTVHVTIQPDGNTDQQELNSLLSVIAFAWKKQQET